MQDIGIYVHIPFCKKKCKYCDFISFETQDCVKEYIDSVIENIFNIGDVLKENEIGNLPEDIQVDTIYFGGGTPSLIDSKYIIQILEKIKAKFKVKNDAEITIEVNPGTVTREKLKDYYENGINRLSIGLQSTQNEILKTIGRIHTYEEFLEVYKIAKDIGYNNINVDLMLALPNQTMENLEESLEKVINLEPNHISLYSLILEEGTKLEEEVEKGDLKLPDEDLERKMYHKTKSILEKNGYGHYEISNFSKKGYESKHNLNCWKQKEYLGLGLASHSYFNNVRFSSEKNLSKYIENNRIEVCEKQTKEDKMKEYMLLGLRKLEGISISKFKSKFGIHPLFYFRFEISKLEEEDLIEVDLDQIKLTKKGLDFANLVFEEFV